MANSFVISKDNGPVDCEEYETEILAVASTEEAAQAELLRQAKICQEKYTSSHYRPMIIADGRLRLLIGADRFFAQEVPLVG